jgi:WhiB family redox-sensing transcriptional regulator
MTSEPAWHPKLTSNPVALGSAPCPPRSFDTDYPVLSSSWHAYAACRGMGSDLFFPPSGNVIAHVTHICGCCPVAESCRTTALDDPSVYGIGAVPVCS